jgi:glutaredoxin-related protein
MPFAKTYQKEVFCLEGDWNKDLKKHHSVQEVLVFLKKSRNIKFIHRHCGTRENLAYYLNQWKLKKYKDYSILYIAFHGKPKQILVGKDVVTLDELAEMLGPNCHNKIIHFGTCHTMNIDKRQINRFLRSTNALCVCGFSKEIKFVEGCAFDILLIDLLQEYRKIETAAAHLKKYYGKFAKKLDFKLHHL